MRMDVVLLPQYLKPQDLTDRTVVVFDVLRATTTIASALASGAKEVRVFGSVEDAESAARTVKDRVLCGERHSLPPEGFDLGNSPGSFTKDVCSGKTLVFTTTNGTKALIASQSAPVVLTGALVNASAVAGALRHARLDVTLLCAGTEGLVSMEDMIGAGAVIAEAQKIMAVELASDVARVSLRLFHACADDLRGALRSTRGGNNVINAKLEPDIDFAARLNAFDVVAQSIGHPPVIRRVDQPERLSV